MTRRRRRSHDQAGFTLVELLVTMVIAMIVLFATLQSADLFGSSAKRGNDVTAAQDAARQRVRDLVSFMRQGRVATGQTTPIPSQWAPSRSDLTVAAYLASATSPSPGEVAGWVRYCTVTTGQATSLLIGVRAGDAYAAPGACAVNDTTNGWLYGVAVKDLIQAPSRLFNFTSTACIGTAAAACLPAGIAVSTVGVQLAIAPSVGATTLGSVITDAVSFRNRSSS